jgi:sugar lactone lactonase YvrE
MTVDTDGGLWVTVFGPGEVQRYAPKGALLARVKISAPCATSCIFGGPERRDLFITSASFRLPDALLSSVGVTADMAERGLGAAGAGGVFMCRPGVTGRPVTSFAG